MGVVGLAGGAWFLLRNDRLYGSPTADTYLLERYHRVPHGDLSDVLSSERFPWLMFRGLYAAPHHLTMYESAGWVLAALAALCVAGAVAWLVRRATSRWSGGPGRAAPGERGPLGVAGWLLVAACCAGTYVGTASFYAEGGAPHPRYFFALVPVTSALLARAICELPGARAWLVATLGLLGTLAVWQILEVADLVWIRRAPPAWTDASGPPTRAHRHAGARHRGRHRAGGRADRGRAGGAARRSAAPPAIAAGSPTVRCRRVGTARPRCRTGPRAGSGSRRGRSRCRCGTGGRPRAAGRPPR